MKTLTALLRSLGFVFASFMAIPLQALGLFFNLPYSKTLPRQYFRVIANLLSMRVTVEGPKPAAGPALILANHASWLDIVAFSSVLPVVFVAKREVADWPVFGLLARLGPTLFVDRERRTDTRRVRNLMERFLEEGRLIVLFPEGTSSDGNRVLPFRSSLVGAAGEGSPGAVITATIAYVGQHGLPLNRALRPRFAWFGQMSLPGHLWRVMRNGPFQVVIRFRDTMPEGQASNRKSLARLARDHVSEDLQALLTGRERQPVFSRADLR